MDYPPSLHWSISALSQALQPCTLLLPSRQGAPLKEVLFGESALPSKHASFTQPALVALALGLYHVITEEYSVLPSAVFGHSLGEISACCVGGFITRKQALELALVRGLAMDSLAEGTGAMVAVMASPESMLSRVKESGGAVSFAAFNSATSCVLSGEVNEILDIAEDLQARGIKATLLPTAHGFHSKDVEPALPMLLQGATSVMALGVREKALADRPLPVVISTLTGGSVTVQYPSLRYSHLPAYLFA